MLRNRFTHRMVAPTALKTLLSRPSFLRGNRLRSSFPPKYRDSRNQSTEIPGEDLSAREKCILVPIKGTRRPFWSSVSSSSATDDREPGVRIAV